MNVIKVMAVIAVFSRFAELGHPYLGMIAGLVIYNLFSFCCQTLPSNRRTK